ncbi:MAG: hypothetical protein JSV88_06240, partial [Candidatus Aminicenantes bacterium]
NEFWNNLEKGVESISFYTDEEMLEAGVSPGTLKIPNYIKAGANLEDKEYFDAGFFGYTPREAELLDPQVRIFHEISWEALEDAGIDPEMYTGLIGVYAGAAQNLEWEVRALLSGKSRSFGSFASSRLTGIRYLCTRLSFNLNLKGPSITIQTACSTSLVAIHLACQALMSGECDVAIAGGVTLSPQKKTGYFYENDLIFSSDGHNRTFDANGDGTVFGEGAGVVVLKPLEEALANEDNIYAVIKSTAINNDGNRKVGFTAPSVEAQVEMMCAAYHVAGIHPETIGCVEAHGTATHLGDPIEIEALKQAFSTNKKGFCLIGSVKTNLGHLDAVSGAAGFIKAVLSLKHKKIPPSLHFEIPNPELDLIDSPFVVNTRLTGWEPGDTPRRAAVNSLGMGGTNAHVVLEEAPEREKSSASRDYQLILLSAKTRKSLDMAVGNLAGFLKRNKDINLADAAYTLQTRRKTYRYRSALVCSCSPVEDAINALSCPQSLKVHEYDNANPDKKIEENPGKNINHLVKNPGEEIPGVLLLLDKIGQAWLQGQTIDWASFYKEEKRHCISLPPYAFDRQRYWPDDANLENLMKQYPGAKSPEDTPVQWPGEIDKQEKTSAPLFPRPDLSTPYVPPTHEIEIGLVEICQELFGYEKIGIMDNFFELGGNSLSVINFVSEIHKKFNTRIQIQDVFANRSLQELSALIKKADKEKYFSIEPAEEKEYYELSSAQKRLYILTRVEKNINTAYNLPQAVIIEGKLDKQQVEASFHMLVNRHQNFRTSFDIKPGKPVQIIHKAVEFKIQYESLPSGTGSPVQENEMQKVIDQFIKPFDITKAPLLRVGLVRLGKEKHMLLLDMHHIISDGVSIAVMVQEFVRLYKGEELPGLRVQYKDFSGWQNTTFSLTKMKNQEDYWLDRFKGDIPTLNLATDYPRQAVKNFTGSHVSREIDRELTGKIKELMKETKTTLYMVLLAAFNILLSGYTEQEDIIVGVPAAARSHPDLENIIGMFVNTLAVRNYPGKQRSIDDFLQEVKYNTLNAFANQDYPFENLVNKLGISKNPGRNPLFDILFVSEDLGIPGLEVKGLTFTSYVFKRKTSHMDLVFFIVEIDNTIVMTLEYATALFSQSSVEGMLKHYVEILEQVVENRDIKLEEIKISHDLIVPRADILKEDQDDFEFL